MSCGPPVSPQDSDCCGLGCSPCVWDIYDQELKLWERQQDEEDYGGVVGGDLTKDVYTRFQIVNITPVTHNTCIYRFALGSGRKLGHKVGDHVIIKAESLDGRSVNRQYTILSQPLTSGYFELMVKIYKTGAMSSVIEAHWQVGHKVACRGPFGGLSYSRNKYKNVVMMAAGTGLAPFVPLVQTILDDDMDETRLRLLFSCKNPDEILLETTLGEFCDYWNFSMKYFFSEANAIRKNTLLRKEVSYAKLSKQQLEEETAKLDLDKTMFLICGSKTYNKEMSTLLTQQLSVSKSQIYIF